MKMKNFKDPKEAIPFFESEIEKHGSISLVDGKSYYDGCYVGNLFYYIGDECIEINQSDAKQLIAKHESKLKIITRREVDGGQTYPIGKKHYDQ